MQTIRAALAIQLKEAMTVSHIHAREAEINTLVFQEWSNVPNLHILAAPSTSKDASTSSHAMQERLSIFSIYIDDFHYNLLAKILNDYYGIQCRGGCNCAGTYGHILFNIPKAQSKAITDRIDQGDNSTKPGWCRLSFHPIMTNAEIRFICQAVKEIAANTHEWKQCYTYDEKANLFHPIFSMQLPSFLRSDQAPSKTGPVAKNTVDNCYNNENDYIQSVVETFLH